MKKIVTLLLAGLLLSSCVIRNYRPLRRKDVETVPVYETFNFDIKDSSQVINQSQYLLKVKLAGIEQFASYHETIDSYPLTKLYVKLDEEGKQEEFVIYWRGGLIETKKDKQEVSTKKKYIHYSFGDLLNLKKNKVYYMAVDEFEDSYILIANEYGLFEETEEGHQIKNNKTDKVIDLKSISD